MVVVVVTRLLMSSWRKERICVQSSGVLDTYNDRRFLSTFKLSEASRLLKPLLQLKLQAGAHSQKLKKKIAPREAPKIIFRRDKHTK